jgi:hypothetical protein
MFRSAKAGKILLELRHIRSEAKRALVQRARDSQIDFFAQTAHLGGQVQVRDSAIFVCGIHHRILDHEIH